MRFSALLLLLFACALAAAALAPTKEGARGRLTSSVPLDAAPGKTLRVRWDVDVDVVADGGGRRPFGATGMFVRLLSRTGSPPTTGVAAADTGPYVANVPVPAGGIGGIRVGLRGSTEIFFPLENDPFLTPGGVRCDVAALRTALTSFVRAFNAGDVDRLERLFSREQFVWFASVGAGPRLNANATNRTTLAAYFARRHQRGDRLSRLTLRFNGYERERGLGHFELAGQRRADDFRNGRPYPMVGKGALECSSPPVRIAVLVLGGPSR